MIIGVFLSKNSAEYKNISSQNIRNNTIFSEQDCRLLLEQDLNHIDPNAYIYPNVTIESYFPNTYDKLELYYFYNKDCIRKNLTECNPERREEISAASDMGNLSQDSISTRNIQSTLVSKIRKQKNEMKLQWKEIELFWSKYISELSHNILAYKQQQKTTGDSDTPLITLMSLNRQIKYMFNVLNQMKKSKNMSSHKFEKISKLLQECKYAVLAMDNNKDIAIYKKLLFFFIFITIVNCISATRCLINQSFFICRAE